MNPFIEQAVLRIRDREGRERHIKRGLRRNYAMTLSPSVRILLRRCAEEVYGPGAPAGSAENASACTPGLQPS